jgi:hypothetical protein
MEAVCTTEISVKFYNTTGEASQKDMRDVIFIAIIDRASLNNK